MRRTLYLYLLCVGLGRVPAAFVFLIRWCFWVKFFGCRGRCVRDLVRDTILCTFFAI